MNYYEFYFSRMANSDINSLVKYFGMSCFQYQKRAEVKMKLLSLIFAVVVLVAFVESKPPGPPPPPSLNVIEPIISLPMLGPFVRPYIYRPPRTTTTERPIPLPYGWSRAPLY